MSDWVSEVEALLGKVFNEAIAAAEARGYAMALKDAKGSVEEAEARGYERGIEDAAKVVDDASGAGPELVAFAGVKHWARSVAAAIRALGKEK